MGQADLRKIELNNRDHNGNCQRLKDETEHLRSKVEETARCASVQALSLS